MSNPLSAYRRSGIQVTLPTKGRYYPEKIETTIDGQIDVFPMTAQDEILLSHPDGLLNGSSIENIVKNCCPAIKEPRNLSSVDIDLLLVAIKLVSYGNNMDVKGKCPHCGKEHTHKINIRNLVDTAKPVPEDDTVRLNDDLVAELIPYDFKAITLISMKEFEEQRIIQMLVSDDINDEMRSKAISESFQRLTKIGLGILFGSVKKIITPTEEVTDRKYIEEFLNSQPKSIVDKIRTKQDELNSCGLERSKKANCPDCGKEYDLPLVYNPSTFFDSNS